MELTRGRVITGVVLLALVVAVFVLLRDDDDRAPVAEGLTVTWHESEESPACTYDEADGTVSARVSVDGRVTRPTTVTATVTAYSDENTSKEVGQNTRSVEVDGVVKLSFEITIPVDKAPHVDEDGVAACSIDSSY